MPSLFQRDFDALHVGAAATTRARTITEADVGLFAGLTGDHHPVHTDAVWAAAHPFGERVAHGMLVASCAFGLLPFDPDRVVALRRLRDVVFKKPVRLGDTIHVEVTITELTALTEDTGQVSCDARVRNQDGALVARIVIDVLWRRDGAQGKLEAESSGEAADEFVPIPL